MQRILLRHWLETKPNDRLAHLVKDAARGLARSLQVRLADHSVSFGNWIFLRILWEQDGLTQRQLSIEAGLAEPTTFTALKTLERRGYIRREHKLGSPRRVLIYLTPEGRALRERLEPLAKEVNEIAIRGVSPDNVAIARQTLLAMIRNLSADEAAAIVADRRVPSTRAVSRMGKRRQKAAARTGSPAQIQ